MSRSQDIMTLLQLDYGLPDRVIAQWCGVQRDHINKVKRGKRQASVKLENSLDRLLDECDRHGVQLSRKPYEWKAGRDVRLHQKQADERPARQPYSSPPPRVTPRTPAGPEPSPHPPSPGHRPRPIESPTRVTREPAVSPKKAPPPRTPAGLSPSASRSQPVQSTSLHATGPLCVGCQRPGVPTRSYAGEPLCAWCAAARGYSASVPPASFVPLDAQHRPVERESPPENVDQAEMPPPDPRAWEPIRPGLNREYLEYGQGRLCLACRARGETHQVRIEQYTQARSVRLCEACCRRYGV